MKSTLIMILFVIANTCFSQINTFYVDPIQTDVNYAAVQDSHLVVRNTTTNIDKLFLFIGGTGSNTKSYKTISNFAGNQGFDVVNISYLNSVPAASLANDTDSIAFTKFRQEVCYGTPSSPAVMVDTFNSIYSRTVKLLNYLNATYPDQNWDQYLSNASTLDWSKIVVGGHSQGGGHACYFAKFHAVERALMFSSPNDYSDHFSNAAHWLRTAGVTEMNKHFAYLSSLDELVSFDKQLSNLEGLGLYPLYDTSYVDNLNTPFSNSHCLYTTQEPGISILYHNATMKFSVKNNSVWEYMLTSDIATTLNEIKKETVISIFPNPTSSLVNVYSDHNLYGKTYSVQNLAGQTVLNGESPNTNHFSLDLSTLESGIYFVTVDRQTFKLVKE